MNMRNRECLDIFQILSVFVLYITAFGLLGYDFECLMHILFLFAFVEFYCQLCYYNKNKGGRSRGSI